MQTPLHLKYSFRFIMIYLIRDWIPWSKNFFRKAMAVKSYFVNELHSIKNNSSATDNSLHTKLCSTNNNVNDNFVTSLRSKIRLLESEKKNYLLMTL